jgi:hypothetical protein
MRTFLNHLEAWLDDKGFLIEASQVELLTKLSAGKPFPLNKAQIEEIAEDLIEDFGARMLANYLMPIDILNFIAGTSRDPEKVMEVVFGEAHRRSKDITGKELDVKYGLFLSPPNAGYGGATGKDPGDKDRATSSAEVIVLLSSRSVDPDKFRRTFGMLYRDHYLAGNFDESFPMFRSLIWDYIVNVLTHEQVHAKDVISAPRSKEFHEITDPKNETLDRLSNRYQIDPYKLLTINVQSFNEDPRFSLNPVEEIKVNRALRGLRQGNDSLMYNLYDVFKSRELPLGYKVILPIRAKSQSLSVKDETIKEYAEKRNLNIDRLLLVNYNNLFASTISRTQNYDYRAESYEDAYNLLQNSALRNYVLSMIVPKGMEIKVIPEYMDIYKMSPEFYILTREESKAHYAQIIIEINDKVKDMGPDERSTLSIEEMIELSPTARKYLLLKKEHPIDNIIKTPIHGEMLGALKKKRFRDFMLRMVYHWQHNILQK